MSRVSRAFWSFSVSITVLVFFAFPLAANAQNGITSIPDLNGDGRSDFLWYNPATGQTVSWLMDGTSVSSSATLLSDPSWKISKTADFNGDGMSDLLWYNAATGQTAASLMNGTSISSWTPLLTDGYWKVIEAVDINGDRKADLLWYNTSTGQTAAWVMNGTSVTSWTVLLTDADWKVTAAADLNGDSMADLLWYNASTGQTAAWIMNGTSVTSWTVLLTDPNWKVIGTADLNGDGMADLLWRNAILGQNAAWIMNGTSATAWIDYPANSDLKIIGAADLNGDRKADLLWRNGLTGQTSVWLMNGLSVTASASLLIDPNWTIATTGDLNRDGKSDLLWYNSSTGQTSAWQMNGTSATGGANLFADPTWRLKCIKASSLTSAVTCDDTVFNAASGAMPPNQAPFVNAGADQTITLPAAANLSGNAGDDGAPIALLIATWSQVSGPGSVTFGNSASLQTTATFSGAGTYILRLTSNDSVFSTSDDVVVVVNTVGSLPTNKAPVVSAGPDQSVALSAGANLLGSVSDDGLPTGSTVAKTWSTVSGPGSVTFGNASAVTTTATFSATGTYALRLTASDSLLSSTDDVVVVVNAVAANQAPVVNAGSDQMITFPASITLAGSANDDGLPTGSLLARSWSKVNGPGTVSFANASSLNSTVTFSVAGSYTLRLTASDSALSSADDVVIIVSPAASTNQAPVVNAGSNQTITFPAGVTLAGTASDDGLPSGSSLTVSWSKVSGPGNVVFVNANSLNSTATFLSAGTYTLQLTASDGTLSTTDDIVVVVNAAPTNQAPVVNAGFDQSITLPAGATLAGAASDDGLPTNSTLTSAWSKVSGPGTVTFGNASALGTSATFSLAGTYTLRLTASDSTLSSNDTVVIVVNPVSVTNQAPVVNAGPDFTITLPAGITLAGSASDDGLPTGSTLTKTWSKVSGPGTVTFGNASSLSSTASFSLAGTYTLRLNASDSLLSVSDDVVFVVNAAASVTNLTPVVNAGTNQTVSLVAGAALSGTATDDGLPSGSSLTTTWSSVSGPGTVTFGNASSPTTTAMFSATGSYVLQLTASDGLLTSSSSLTVTVISATGRTFYIDFASGSDSNNGTSKSTPWKHVKGMQGCTAACNSITLAAGDQIIFKGGVTWTASFPWVFSGGSSSANVTYTTDRTWFAGGSFTQPTFDDGHANPGGVGMANATSTGYITLNDLNWINCGTAQVANTNKCLVFSNTHDITITNSTFSTESWISIYFVFSAPGSYSNFTWTRNDFSHTSGAVWFASAQSNTTMHNVTYNSNTFHDFTSQIGGGVHGDGALHYYSVPSGDSTQYLDGVTFCNNRFYGDFRRSFGTDGAMTGFFFSEGSISGIICNNDMSYSPAQANMFDGLIVLGGGNNIHPSVVAIYNNSIAAIGTNAMSSAINMAGMVSPSSITIKNNIISAPLYCMYFQDPATSAAVTSDYNLLNCSSGQLATADGMKSYSQWRSLGFDIHSVMGSDPLWVAAPGNENLSAGSLAKTSGTNLSSTGIAIVNSDAIGTVRPSTGAWAMGAFQ